MSDKNENKVFTANDLNEEARLLDEDGEYDYSDTVARLRFGAKAIEENENLKRELEIAQSSRDSLMVELDATRQRRDEVEAKMFKAFERVTAAEKRRDELKDYIYCAGKKILELKADLFKFSHLPYIASQMAALDVILDALNGKKEEA